MLLALPPDDTASNDPAPTICALEVLPPNVTSMPPPLVALADTAVPPCTNRRAPFVALVLLATPSRAFAFVVPWLIGLASLAIVIRPNRAPRPSRDVRSSTWKLSAGVFLVGVYGGYFGAAAGVLLIALLLVATAEPLARANALKNVLPIFVDF